MPACLLVMPAYLLASYLLGPQVERDALLAVAPSDDGDEEEEEEEEEEEDGGAGGEAGDRKRRRGEGEAPDSDAETAERLNWLAGGVCCSPTPI